MRPQINRAVLDALAPDDPRRKEAEAVLAELEALYADDPVQRFYPLSVPQGEFMAADTKIQAAFAGNRFGKTTALLVKCFIQHYPLELLPDHLKPYKRAFSEPVKGWFLCPSFRVLETTYIPKFREWAPRRLLKGGSFDKAWKKQDCILQFADGGSMGVFTYDQDPDKLIGADVDYVAYDEPPPQAHRTEALTRLIDRDGPEMFAMTPVNMQGGGIGWIYRRIWKRRGEPGVTVVQGSIHDNPLLSESAKRAALEEYPEEERRAREFGEFVHFGGMVYEGGFEQALADPPTREHVKGLDVVVGIDPGLRNAAVVWIGFDSDNVGCVFDEVLLQDRTPKDYAQAIKRTNAKWGVTGPLFVIDPSARNRSLVNAESVEAALQREGINCVHGQNAVEAGVQEVRKRLQQGALVVSRDCMGLRSEAEEYRIEDRPDGEFKVVKENDHRLDALRYGCMSRAWHSRGPYGTAEPPTEWVPGEASPHLFNLLGQNREVPPMGSMS